MPAPKRFNKGSISVSEGALRHLRCHPCRVFSYSYGSQAPFHGGSQGGSRSAPRTHRVPSARETLDLGSREFEIRTPEMQ